MGNTLEKMVGFYRVGQSTVAVKEKWGRFVGIVEPGCHYMPWCIGERIRSIVSLRVHQLNVRCVTKTKENVFVTVVASVQYRCHQETVEDAVYKLSNPTEQISAYVYDVVRATVPLMFLDDVFEQKNDIADSVKEELQKAMTTFGYVIVNTLIIDIEPDQVVKKAMNEINAAARMRLATLEKAEAEKILKVKRAEADAESKYQAGVGVARQRQAIVDGLRDSVMAFSDNVPGTTPNEVMDMVLVTQYFDTMRDIGAHSKNSTLFIPHGVGGARDAAEQIRSGVLHGSAEGQQTPKLL